MSRKTSQVEVLLLFRSGEIPICLGNPGCADKERYVNTDRRLYGIHGRKYATNALGDSSRDPRDHSE